MKQPQELKVAGALSTSPSLRLAQRPLLPPHLGLVESATATITGRSSGAMLHGVGIFTYKTGSLSSDKSWDSYSEEERKDIHIHIHILLHLGYLNTGLI